MRHEVGGRAEPIPAGEEELLAGGQVVGAHDVPRVHCQGQGVAVHAHCAHIVCVARTTLRPLLGRTVQFGRETSVGPRICSPMAATTSSAHPSSGKRTAISRAEAERRIKAIEDAGAFRAPTNKATRKGSRPWTP